MIFLKPFRSQKFIIELWLVDTLKRPIKTKLSKLLLLLHFDLLINNLDFISSRMYRRSPLPFPFLSYLYGTLKPFIWNWAEGKESSSFVSDIRSKSILLSIMYVSASNLFLTELLLRWPNINLSGDWILISLSPFFASLILLSQIYGRQSVAKLAYLLWCLYPYVLGHL